MGERGAAADLLKDGDVFFVSGGLYHRDTQFVSRYAWSVGDGAHLTRRPAVAGGALVETVEVTSHASRGSRISLRLLVGSRFRDVFEVRGWVRARRGRDLPPAAAGASAFLAYCGLDGVERRVRVSVAPEPTRWETGFGEEPEDTEGPEDAEGPDGDGGPGGSGAAGSWVRAVWDLALVPGRAARVQVTVIPEAGDERESVRPADALPAEAARRATRSGGGAQVATGDPGVAAVLERSRSDLEALLEDHGHGPFPVAGLPWFAAPFGRDALLTAYQVIHLDPAVAAATLRTLAALQGRRPNPVREEQPGKIVHEVRRGEMANLGEVPFGRYYGSVDATPLFLVLFGEVWRWTGDRAFIEELLPAAEAALAWLQRDGDPDGDGFVEFHNPRGTGLTVQSWKDAADSMRHAGGRPALSPLAVCEVQGYAYDAYRRLARVYRDLGRSGDAARLTGRARRLKARFRRAFWMPGTDYVAMALDRDKRRVEAVASDAGHCLWSGIVAPERAPAVARRLLGPELWSGWGVRTLAAGEAAYDALSYHNGSVWPHDTALCAAGLKRYGFAEAARRVADGLLAAAERFPAGRLPELFGGQPRNEGGPVPYPAACAPQAWAAAAPLFLLRVLLGLEADAPRGVLYLAPAVPRRLGRVRVTGLAVGAATVDLEVEGTAADVLRVEGPCRVLRGTPHREAAVGARAPV